MHPHDCLTVAVVSLAGLAAQRILLARGWSGPAGPVAWKPVLAMGFAAVPKLAYDLWIVLNEPAAMEAERARLTLIPASGPAEPLPELTKAEGARRLLERALALLAERRGGSR